jgi:hypothetical protein
MFFWYLDRLIGVNQSRTLEYMEILPHNLPETSTLNVEISPLLCGFIWRCGRIIAQGGFYVARF